MKVKRILLIGGTGYIGTAVYRQLSKNYLVNVTGRQSKPDFGGNFQYLDYSDPSSIKTVLGREQYDLMVILAANKTIKPLAQVNFKDSLFRDNVAGLNNLLIQIGTLPPPVVIFMSSMTVYSPDVTSPVKENSLLIPIHNYGLSKLIGEQLFSYHLRRWKGRGVIVRLPGVFGGQRQGGYIYFLIKQMLNNRPVEVNSTGLGFWEAIYLDDLVEIFTEFVRKYPAGKQLEVFNLGYGKEVDFIKTADLIKRLIRSKSEIKVTKRDYVKFFLDNHKISKYVNLKKYSYSQALRRYIQTLL